MVQQSEALGFEERRRQTRYKLNEGVFAFLGSTPCSIMDISQGGMALNYVVLNEQEVMPLFFGLFSPEKKVYLKNIPGALVAQRENPNAPSYSVLQTKRLCIQFDPLPEEKVSKLNEFIVENSIGLA